MYKFIRWYNQNRMTFFIGVAIIALIIIMIQILNAAVKEQNEEKKNIANSVNNSTNTNTSAFNNTNTSVITGETVSSSTDKANTEIIKEFVEYCNNGEIEEAYNMLSDECKELIYPSLEYFTANYYQKVFYINRMYNLENWYSNGNLYTYYITYTEDVLASGNTNSEDNRGDYITVVNKSSGYELNISSYVGRKEINNSETIEDVTIILNWIDMYMDYTIANISVINNTEETICVDTKENASTTYMYDTNSVKYESFLNENASEQLIIPRGITMNLYIKFNKIYNLNREISGICLKDIVLNYENYISGEETKEQISIDIKTS